MKFRTLLAAAAFMGMATSAALAQNAYTTANVNMRAGPSTEYPKVATLPNGAAVDVHGCLENWNWCDTSWRGIRGWVSGRYLQMLYNNRRVYLPEYAPRIGIPIITFSFGNYWDRWYRDRPWYRERDRWRDFRPFPPRPGAGNPPPPPPPGWDRPRPPRPGAGTPPPPPPPGWNRPNPPRPGAGNPPPPPPSGWNRPNPPRPGAGNSPPPPPSGWRPPQPQPSGADTPRPPRPDAGAVQRPQPGMEQPRGRPNEMNEQRVRRPGDRPRPGTCPGRIDRNGNCI